jgi:hypothetical protein
MALALKASREWRRRRSRCIGHRRDRAGTEAVAAQFLGGHNIRCGNPGARPFALLSWRPKRRAAVPSIPARTQGPALHERVGPLLVSVPGTGSERHRACGDPTRECRCSVGPGADARSGPTWRVGPPLVGVPGTGSERHRACGDPTRECGCSVGPGADAPRQARGPELRRTGKVRPYVACRAAACRRAGNGIVRQGEHFTRLGVKCSG